MARPRPCPNPCNVLLVGGGGREHALAWKLRQSPHLGELWTSHPEHAGLAELCRPCPASLDPRQTFHLERWCERESIHLIIVGPEAPLADGLADRLATDDRLVFGPKAAGAQIEADKAFAKEIMRQAAVPTAEGRVFNHVESAREFIEVRDEACVVKASGLAAGKGVFVCDTPAEALAAVDQLMSERVFGEAGAKVIVEERLQGQEVSLLAFVDGRTIWLLDSAQDHKQVGEGDRGPNTGGMGAYCPTTVLDAPTLATIEREVFVSTVDALRREGIEYRGVLYAGLMLTPGGPKVLEFNCRFGDPECQPLMTRLHGDLVEICWATAAGTLDSVDFNFDPRHACCVVMCSAGYPGPYEKGHPITGLEDAVALAGEGETIHVFHAGTKRNADGELVTDGGRVLGVTALAGDLQRARDLANAACEQIHFEGAFFRHDIADRVLVRT